MNILSIVILVLIAIYMLSGAYKGFLWSASAFAASIVACLLAMLLMRPVGKLIRSNQSIYEAMESYTEGAEYVPSVEDAKTDITKLTNEKIDEIMENAALPFPVGNRVYENIMNEAFKDEGISTLGDYFNESMVRMFINTISFIGVYFIIRVILTFLLCWADYSLVFPTLRHADRLIGCGVGAVRGVLGVAIIMMVVPIVLTVLPFDAIKELVNNSSVASFFYGSNLLLRLIPGV